MAKADILKDQLNLSFPAMLEEIDYVCSQIKQLLNESGYDHMVFEVVLLAREALSNAIKHGCKFDCNKQIKFSIGFNNNELIMRIEDEGTGFDWKNGLKKKTNIFSHSGRGLPTFKYYADDVKYNKKGNKITIIKQIKENTGDNHEYGY